MRPAEWHTKTQPATSVIHRMTQIIAALYHFETPCGIRELARYTGLPPSTVGRLVRDMIPAGLLDRHAGGVTLGLQVFQWGSRAWQPRFPLDAAMPLLTDLYATTQQTIHLAVLDGADVLYLEILPRLGGPQLPSRVGGRLPAHATGVGKALLAASPARVVDELVATGLPSLGPRTIRQPGLLRRQLARVATTGIAVDHEESGPGIVCVATVIRDTRDNPVAAISAAGWSGKMNVRQVASAVYSTAHAIGRTLRPAGDGIRCWRPDPSDSIPANPSHRKPKPQPRYE
ncbi:IclR family transcriptional regulator [Mycobacterium vicinigordonae]|uniref:IclR family transcriptional regulator n=1 Tax=Mycobacterium vicinigordonae TaxID=1719132 RepID=A0A7D6E063_9MYCO|nr:IclR family transcriptional regulator [Mycobacterium vicinigordonae]QLL07889.1 IclR family transcriptional regulator [Mycobacterium vicinigordonae]